MVIHFICRGNTHRSRLAEAYARSFTQDICHVTIWSSGIEADRDLSGPIVPFVKSLLQQESLYEFTRPGWTQTTQPMLDASDLLVFMSDDVFEDAVTRFQIPAEKSLKWQIPDAEGVDGQIRSAVVELVSRLRPLP
jgi:protein-tyrosine-phosphatase